MNDRPLTRRQKQVLDFIDRTQRKTGLFPTLMEITSHFKYRSPNSAQAHVKALTAKGALEKIPGKARAFRIITPIEKHKRPIVHVPVYGTVPAGFPDPENDQPEGCITIDVGALGVRPNARTFGLRVRGDSMVGRHICDGDHVICEYGAEPKSGDVVVALIDQESTLKTFVRERRKSYLKAENPAYPELVPVESLTVQGVVVAVMRRLS